MTDEMWRPLGVDTEDEIAKYDALHDDVPGWMWAPLWRWIQASITVDKRYRDGSGRFDWLDADLTDQMAQRLRIMMTILRPKTANTAAGVKAIDAAIQGLVAHRNPLQIADYLLANGGHARPEDLEAVLKNSKSAWTVGVRAGRSGLLRRVPLGVQRAADAVMAGAGNAGIRLAKAWEALYGLDPDPSQAYRLAIQAVEDASIPVVSPRNDRATLGTVLRDIAQQGDWKLPMIREHTDAPSGDVLIGMMRMLWHGQHDRHGGDPSAPGNVSSEEATVAVGLAVTLVQWFDAGLLRLDGMPSGWPL